MVQLPPTSLLNKHHKQTRFSIKPLILCFPMLAAGLTQDALAWVPDIRNYWVRDYLDFGQNKGIFKPGATGLVLHRKGGGSLALPDVPFPDFSPISKHGPTTSIGGAYAVTAYHNKKYGSWHQHVGKPQWGYTTYQVVGDNYINDFAVTRLNKFVVETQGVTSGVKGSLTKEQALERYGVDFNGKKQILVYRAGSGVFRLRHEGGIHEMKEVAYVPELLAGSIWALDGWANDRTYAKEIFDFSNRSSTGDSGSGSFVWDNIDKRWVLLGVLRGELDNNLGTHYRLMYDNWNQQKVDELKQRYTHKVSLEGKHLQLSSQNLHEYTIESQKTTFGKDKDLSFTGGGIITLGQNFDQGIGGLIFDEGKSYIVNGDGFKYKGAGLDIGKNSTVDWNISGMPNDNMHKIGAGTLNVNVQQGNNLKIGNGTVVLNAEKTFNKIYVASGAGTVKLGKANALDSSDKANGIYFASRGGTLDVNGFDQIFQRIAASDEGAVITNTSKQIANIQFKLPWAYAYHGQFKGNLNVKHEFDNETTNQVDLDKRHLVLDGGMNIDGELTVKNAKLTFQGMPELHALFKSSKCTMFPACTNNNWVDVLQKYENNVNQALGTAYKTLNQINALQQPDWVTRTFKFKTLTLDNSSVNVGRNAWLYGDINAKNSTVNFSQTGTHLL